MEKQTSLVKGLIGLMMVIFFIAVSCQNKPEQSVVTYTPQDLSGEELYISYCQICHGTDGNGPMTEVLTIPPPDLRKIAARRDGVFPKEELKKVIDGREGFLSHGTRDMPIWGAVFANSEDLNNEEQIAEKISLLIDYLETIQVADS